MANREHPGSMLRHLDDVHQLTDGQLIDAVMEEVWADMSIKSRGSWLVHELLHRFQSRADIEETPAGITLDGYPLWPDVIGDDEINEQR